MSDQEDTNQEPGSTALSEASAEVSPPEHVAISPSGERSVWAKRMGTLIAITVVVTSVWGVWWWLAQPAGLLKTITLEDAHLTVLFIDPDSGVLYAGSDVGNVFAVDVVNGTASMLPTQFESAITCLIKSEDGFLSAGTVDGEMGGWQLGETPKAAKVPGVLPGMISAMDLPKGRFEVATGLSDGRVLLLSGSGFRELGQKNPVPVTDVKWLPGDRHIISGDGDGRIRFWPATSAGGTRSESHRVHTTRVSCIRLSDEGSRILTADLNGELILWDAVTRQQITPGVMQQSAAVSDAILIDESILTSGFDENLRIWSIADGTLLDEIPVGAPVLKMVRLPGNDRIATIDGSDTIRIFELPAALK